MRRFIQPGRHAAVWCGGRWGPRRVRVGDCAYTLTAEDVYTAILRDRYSAAGPGAVGVVRAFGVSVRWQMRRNRVWRFGRVFLNCPRCSRLATRLYRPLRDSALACRTCWGLSYESQQNSYKQTGWSALLGTIGESQTQLARDERQKAAAQRYAARRAILWCRD